MQQYFLYNAIYGNTIVGKSNTSYSPVPPYDELYIDFTTPDIQPLYLYRVDSGLTSIIVNSQDNINSYLGSSGFTHSVDSNVTYGEFTANTTTQNAKIDALSAYTTTAGLQQITAISATTTIESTFIGGIKTGHIRPTGNTTTAIQIRNASGIPIINVDSVSGFTGFKTTTPLGLVHAYGTDVNGKTQSNAFIIDGLSTADKDIQWAENGVPKWLAEIYRNEDAKFWYLYNVEDDNSPIVISETGRVGINNPSDVLDYHSIMINGGLDDLVVSGLFTQSYNVIFVIEIDSITGITDTFKWKISDDGGNTYGAWSASSGCTTGATTIIYGVGVAFENVTGHTLGTSWTFVGFSQLPLGTFVISPVGLTEVLYSLDYTTPTISYIDITGNMNSSNFGNLITIFPTGSTVTAMYSGTRVPIDSLYLNLITAGAGIQLVAEYWNGSSWIVIDDVVNNYKDGTFNLTRSGAIAWEASTLGGWIPAYMQDLVVDEHELYWLRARTTTSPTISPVVNSLARGGDVRLGVMTSPFDVKPSFFVDSLGRTSIGGGNITGKNLLQINKSYNVPPPTAFPSLVEIDSEDSGAADLKIRLSSDDNIGAGIVLGNSRGTLANQTNAVNGDETGHLIFRIYAGSVPFNSGSIIGRYLGDGNTKKSALILSSYNDTTSIETIRLQGERVGFGGVSSPTAIIHITGGTTSIAPLRFTSGALLSSPQTGGVEFDGSQWYGTTGTTRNTFAFLESPVFIGMPEFPSGTTFAQGLTTCSIRPLVDSVCSIHIRKANNITPIVTFNTLSGFTGFGKTPDALVNLYGTDTYQDAGWNYQTNGVRLDGCFASDKDIQWYSEGQPKFTAQIYRCEDGKYWYLSSPQGKVNQLTVSETGRVGINNQSNIMTYHAILENGGPNDIGVGGFYTQNYTTVYQIEIDGITGITDTFKWRKSTDEGQIFNSWSPSSGCTTGTTELEYGVTIQFDSVIGHTLGTRFIFTAFAQLPVGSLVVTPNSFTEVQTTIDYTISGSTVYNDVTAEANSSTFGLNIKIFETGTTDSAIYFGTLDKLNSIFVNLSQFGVGVTLIVEYWTGSVWENLSLLNNSYIDDTVDLTKSGAVTWETGSMINWIPAYMPNLVEDGYLLYWIRLRTSTNPTVSPIAISFARNGKYRIAVLSSPSDFKPSFYVDSLGRTNVGGGNITGCNLLQINKDYNMKTVSLGRNNLVEIDSNCAETVDLKIKLSSNDAYSGGLTIVKTRGCLACACDVQYNDILGHLDYRAQVNNAGGSFSCISSQYKGNGITCFADLVFSTAGGGFSAEKVRITSSGTTGFGISPTAVIHVKAGTTSIAPLRFTSGALLTSPQSGAVEFLSDKFYGTTTGGTRNTFAFLESPQFTGAPNLPVGTTLNSQSLCNYILTSGGTNNSVLLNKATFATYTGTTAPATYKTIASVDYYTGTTAPATYLTKTVFNAFTGSTVPIVSVVITGATNGLNKPTVHNVELGGSLTKNTVITGSTFDLTLSPKALNLRAANGVSVCDDSTAGICIHTNGGNIDIRGNNAVNIEKTKLVLGDTLAAFTDSRAVPVGIQYNGDYSASYTARSLVDKAYVDANTGGGGLIIKTAVTLATTGNSGLSGLTIIDSIQTMAGMRVLVKNQINGADNGVYSASTGTWGRTSDFDQDIEVVNGSYFYVITGATNARSAWVLTTPNPITVGVTLLTFTLFNTESGVVEGNGICITQSGGNYNIAVKTPPNSSLCTDNSGLYINCAIAGIGLTYNTGVLNVNGSALAGNSISWTGNTFNVDTTTGTLNTALNSKTNVSVFNSFTGTTQTLYNNTLEPTGFINQQNLDVTYSVANRTINITATTGTIQYYWRGILHDLGTSWTSTAHTNDLQGWYLYSTDGDNIVWSTADWKFSDLQVASRQPNVTFGLKEIHGTMPYSVHEELHDIIGTYVNAGFGLTFGSYTIQPAVPNNGDNTPSFDSGVIQDEDLHTAIAAWNQGSYTLAYFPNTTNVVFETGVTSIFKTGTTYPLINSWNGGVFSNVEMTDGYFANWYAFRIPVTSDAHSQTYRLFIVQPQYEYTTLLSAQGESITSLQLDGLKNNFDEYVPVERITMGANVNYSGATGRVRIEAEGILVANKFGRVGNIVGVGTTASNVSVMPTSPFTSTNLQGLSDEYAAAITARLTTSSFNSFTGTTLPANYYNKAQINAYTGATATAISLKAPITSPTFLVSANAPNPALNDKSTRIATTCWYSCQCATALPLMDGTANVGTSLLWTKQDHVHPSDTSRLSTTSFATYSGTTAPAAFATKAFVSNYTGTTAPATYLSKTDFNTYSGTTVPNTYYNKICINAYTASTATAINLKAPITSPTFLVSARSVTPIVNDNSTCIATTAWYIGQGGTATPLMDNIGACGTSNLFARQDHVHPSDTSRVAKSGDTMTGALIINSDLTVTGVTKLGNVTPDVNQQNFTVIDVTTNKIADSGTKFHVYGSEYQLASDLTSTSTTSLSPVIKVTMTTTSLPAGTYKIVVHWVWSRNTTSTSARFDVTIGGIAQGTRPTMEMESGDVTDIRPETRIFYKALSGVNTIEFRHWAENVGNSTVTSDATIELIRVT
jgi:hypothetical protein